MERGEEQLRRPNAAMRRECFLVGKVQRCTCWGAHPPPPSAHPPPCAHPQGGGHPQGRSSCGGRARRRPTKSRCGSPVFRRCTCSRCPPSSLCTPSGRCTGARNCTHLGWCTPQRGVASTSQSHAHSSTAQTNHAHVLHSCAVTCRLLRSVHRKLGWLLALKSYKPW